jgi:hypothetical protein
MPPYALELAMAAVDAGQIADRGIFENKLGGILALRQARFDREQLPTPFIILQMLLEQAEFRSH